MAIVRPRPRASTISSRYGAHALALGARPGDESVDTRAVVAGFERPGSVDTSGVVAGFGGQARGRANRPILAVVDMCGLLEFVDGHDRLAAGR